MIYGLARATKWILAFGKTKTVKNNMEKVTFTISGGEGNTTVAGACSVCGGAGNTASGFQSVVIGGQNITTNNEPQSIAPQPPFPD